MIKKARVSPKEMYEGTIQLRTKNCSDFAIKINVGGKIIQEEQAPAEFVGSTNSYLNAERARKLGFALLSAANKADRAVKKNSKE